MHEHLRPEDTPDWCDHGDTPRDNYDGVVAWNDWDRNSVMNYCADRVNNGGELSVEDKRALQRYYGIPKPNTIDVEGSALAGRPATLVQWPRSYFGARVDIFRNGVRVVSSTPHDGHHLYLGTPGDRATSATVWVCQAGRTSYYDARYCSGVKTVTYPATGGGGPLPPSGGGGSLPPSGPVFGGGLSRSP